ncbi:MAG: aminotransferase class IV [Gemmataceae bacterium]|nr:aminotransferase class IV [Gemmata sp.]MDW8198360.1 aminotransferase class IV [Gemmataceae bacterium]
MSWVWLNGQLVDKLHASVNVFDHGFLYCDGVWEHLRMIHSQIIAYDVHSRHLFQAAAALGIDIPYSHSELESAILSTATENQRTNAYVRIIVTRGVGTIGPDPRKLDPQVIIIVEEYQPFPRELYGYGLHTVISPLSLDLDNPAHRYRTLNQLHIVQAKRYALTHGCLEALFPTRQGHLVCSTEGCLWAVQRGQIIAAAGQPENATFDFFRTWLHRSSCTTLEQALTLTELVTMDEVFIVGTACGIIGIVRIDGATIGSGTEGSVTRSLRDDFERFTQTSSR